MAENAIQYHVGTSFPHRHFISFRATFPAEGNSLLIQLAAWRPGRYELGNFSKNIRKWEAKDESGNSLPWRKLNKDMWEVDCKGKSKVEISYQFYAPDINAGSSYLDEEQLYINPVNCFFFLPEYPGMPYHVHLELPANYEVATGLKPRKKHSFRATNFDELADCPFIASATLEHHWYEVEKKVYHIWIQGEHAIAIDNLVKAFADFTAAQIRLFGSIPCDEYHFLFQFPPYFVRHGVEHSNSTVIAMGPGSGLNSSFWYNELLGISCHELFHTWNVKNIRPAEMTPYDFSGENYSRLGFVYEGVTTYYGDQLLLRSGGFTKEDYFQTLNEVLQKHFDNAGRRNHSVSESSFDTWLDGYVPGIPWRKVSIYTEGCLIAFICDVWMMRATGNQRSLDDVMVQLYKRTSEPYHGYTGEEYQSLMEEISGISFAGIYDQLVNGTGDFTPFIEDCFSYLGLTLRRTPNASFVSDAWGILTESSQGKVSIASVEENSPADKAALWIGDVIISINGWEVTSANLNKIAAMYANDCIVNVLRKGKVKSAVVKADGKAYFTQYTVDELDECTPQQAANFSAWSKR